MRGAYELASSIGVSLCNASAISRWVRQVERLERERANEELPTRSGARDAGGERAIEDARKRAS